MSYAAELLFNKIEDVLLRIGPKKFAGVVSDNASTIAAARRKINEKYPSILNKKYQIKGGGLKTFVETY